MHPVRKKHLEKLENPGGFQANLRRRGFAGREYAPARRNAPGGANPGPPFGLGPLALGPRTFRTEGGNVLPRGELRPQPEGSHLVFSAWTWLSSWPAASWSIPVAPRLASAKRLISSMAWLISALSWFWFSQAWLMSCSSSVDFLHGPGDRPAAAALLPGRGFDLEGQLLHALSTAAMMLPADLDCSRVAPTVWSTICATFSISAESTGTPGLFAGGRGDLLHALVDLVDPLDDFFSAPRRRPAKAPPLRRRSFPSGRWPGLPCRSPRGNGLDDARQSPGSSCWCGRTVRESPRRPRQIPGRVPRPGRR